MKINDFDDNYIYVSNTITRNENDKSILGKTTKTHSSKRIITINNTINNILKNSLNNSQKNKNNLLFCDNQTAEIITPSEINSYLQRINKKYNISNRLHNHILRHTFATRCIESGMNIKVLSKKLGHSNIQTTLNTYASILDKFESQEDEKLQKYLFENNITIT